MHHHLSNPQPLPIIQVAHIYTSTAMPTLATFCPVCLPVTKELACMAALPLQRMRRYIRYTGRAQTRSLAVLALDTNKNADAAYSTQKAKREY